MCIHRDILVYFCYRNVLFGTSANSFVQKINPAVLGLILRMQLASLNVFCSKYSGKKEMHPCVKR